MMPDPAGQLYPLIHRVIPMGEPLVSFQDHADGACYGYTARGVRYDVTALLVLQNPIEQESDFHTYMLMEARRRFYWLEQRMLESRGQGWWLAAELIPHFPPTFSREMNRAFQQLGPGRIVLGA